MAVELSRLEWRATYRRRKQLVLFGCVLIFLSIFSTIQYVMTAILLDQWPPVDQCSVASLDAIESQAGSRHYKSPSFVSRTLGVAMPTINYAMFKELERRHAQPDDPDVLSLARESIMRPPELHPPFKVNSRSTKPTPLAILVEQIIDKVRLVKSI